MKQYSSDFIFGGGCRMQPQWIEASFLGCWWWHFVVSAVRVKLNRWGHSCPGLLSVSRDIITSPTASSLSSSVPPPPPKKNPWNYPAPPVCHWDHEELPLLLCLPPLSEHAFLEGRLLFIPSGGLTVNLLHWGKFLGVGPISVGILYEPHVLGVSLYIYVSPVYLSIWLSIHLSFGQRSSATRRFFFSPLSFSLVLFSGRIIGQASTSFHFQPQQTERLH